MLARRHGRCLALEVLYEHDLANHPALAVLSRRLAEKSEDEEGDRDENPEPLDGPTLVFTRDLINGVVANQDEFDQLIARYAPEWPLDQIAVIDRNILRLAIYEILIDQTIPIKVAINEAVELGKLYGSDSTSRFVNGVLGSLADEADAVRQTLLTPQAKPSAPP